MNILSRLERLEKQNQSRDGVGLIVCGTDGFTVKVSRMEKTFSTEAAASDFYYRYFDMPLIIIDV